jgi:WD40 repeat protein
VRLWFLTGGATREGMPGIQEDGGGGQPLAALRGHTGGVRGVALSDNGQLVVSGGIDGTVKVWEASSGACLRTLRPERRYERLDITRLTGITDAQRQALSALGAVDRSGAR